VLTVAVLTLFTAVVHRCRQSDTLYGVCVLTIAVKPVRIAGCTAGHEVDICCNSLHL